MPDYSLNPMAMDDGFAERLAKSTAETVIAKQAAEIERLRAIETAARSFVQEADDYPRYAPVKVWATPEADPYLKLKAALNHQQLGSDPK